MAQTVEELVALGLSEAEATRVVNRKAKAEAKSSSTIATAKKRLPAAQKVLDHASDRVKHWQGVADEAGAKVAKYTTIIVEGEGEGEPVEAAPAPEPKARRRS